MVQDVVGSKFPAKNGYGQNGYSGASSAKIGEVSAGFKATPDDPVREEVARLGTNHHDCGSQVRHVDDTPLPAAFGHGHRGPMSGSPGGIVPPVLGFKDESNPVRQPK